MIINKDKIRKKLTQLRYMENFEGLLFTLRLLFFYLFILIGIHSMQGWTARVRRNEAQKDWSVQEICLERIYS